VVFCKLAVRHDVVPVGWDWPAFLRVAETLLPYAFEKADAKEKWGRENVFAVLTFGRSLRATAEVVYANLCQEQGPSAAMRAMTRRCRHPGPEWHDVGGRHAWQALARALGEDPAWWTSAAAADVGEEGEEGEEDDYAEIVASRSAPWRAAAQAKEADDSQPLQPQDRVMVSGLVGRPELNEALATVLLPVDPVSGRCCVRGRRPEVGFCALDDVKLKPQNLSKMPLPTVAPAKMRRTASTRCISRPSKGGRSAPNSTSAKAPTPISSTPTVSPRTLGLTPAAALPTHAATVPRPGRLDSAHARACLWAQAEVVQLLLAHGATPDVPATTTGSTALMFATMHARAAPTSAHHALQRLPLQADRGELARARRTARHR